MKPHAITENREEPFWLLSKFRDGVGFRERKRVLPRYFERPTTE